MTYIFQHLCYCKSLQRACQIPEGPELRISSELIKPIVQGKYLIGFSTFPNGRYKTKAPEGASEFQDNLFKYKGNVLINNVDVKGKFMFWTFSNDWHMFVTYGMTGQFSPEQGKHPCAQIDYLSGAKIESIYFNDPRHFGTIKFVQGQNSLVEKLNTLGWDPFTGLKDYNLALIKATFKDSTKPLAQLLMDQSIFAGVGNYIKSECLYQAKLSPHRLGNSLSNDEIYGLCQAIIDVMETSYQHQGATLSTYKTPYGDEGKYSTFFKVYGNKKDPLGNKVIKETLADKRTTHWVPAIQR